MLSQFKKSLQKLSSEKQIEIIQKDLAIWAKEETTEKFEAITLMEAGEFLPDFIQVVKRAALSLKTNGLFLLTKPPEYMAWLYLGRKQTNKQITELLKECGFDKIQINNWTSRYEVIWAWKA